MPSTFVSLAFYFGYKTISNILAFNLWYVQSWWTSFFEIENLMSVLGALQIKHDKNFENGGGGEIVAKSTNFFAQNLCVS